MEGGGAVSRPAAHRRSRHRRDQRRRDAQLGFVSEADGRGILTGEDRAGMVRLALGEEVRMAAASGLGRAEPLKGPGGLRNDEGDGELIRSGEIAQAQARAHDRVLLAEGEAHGAAGGGYRADVEIARVEIERTAGSLVEQVASRAAQLPLGEVGFELKGDVPDAALGEVGVGMRIVPGHGVSWEREGGVVEFAKRASSGPWRILTSKLVLQSHTGSERILPLLVGRSGEVARISLGHGFNLQPKLQCSILRGDLLYNPPRAAPGPPIPLR